jgi:hypothetical protein
MIVSDSDFVRLDLKLARLVILEIRFCPFGDWMPELVFSILFEALGDGGSILFPFLGEDGTLGDTDSPDAVEILCPPSLL